ncbi:unnamed protein product [Phytophthora fragariaefolia]|uniref:Unnamed protein product n=1 Tax=Phytophthora fragariaefolia TaxID=1490495 RepID=A0A9W6TP65_9STRA|nr:unnamed protein product [Phytophthora fragariaefolia]
MTDIPCFMDRGNADIAAGSTLGLQLHFCTRHIVDNVKKNFKGRLTAGLDWQLYKIQRSKCEKHYESQLVEFGANNKDIGSYFRQIPSANWVRYPLLDPNMLYGWRTTNFVESANGRAIPARELHPSGFFIHYMESIMETKFERWDEAQAWIAEGKVITKYAADEYEVERKIQDFCLCR